MASGASAEKIPSEFMPRLPPLLRSPCIRGQSATIYRKRRGQIRALSSQQVSLGPKSPRGDARDPYLQVSWQVRVLPECSFRVHELGLVIRRGRAQGALILALPFTLLRGSDAEAAQPVDPEAVQPTAQKTAQQIAQQTAAPQTAAPQTAPETGTERRQERRTSRTERRQERRTARTERRQERRTARTERRQERRTARKERREARRTARKERREERQTGRAQRRELRQGDEQKRQ